MRAARLPPPILVNLADKVGVRTLALPLAVSALLLTQAALADEAVDAGTESLWSILQRGRIAFSVRQRFEAFDREGAPFTGAAYAPTLRLALGYETPSFHGWSAFAEGAAIVVTGRADYSVPTLPWQNRPNRPAILDPLGVELNQGYLRWRGAAENVRMTITVGRQEIMLNDGRFVSTSSWRQNHESFDAARLNADLPHSFAFTYAFLNRYFRVVGHDASDGKPPMHSHLMDLAWKRAGQVNVSLYGLLLDYRSSAQHSLSTQTFGLRASGPYQISRQWSLLYAAEAANQRNFGANPNHVNVNYYLCEAGPAWRGFGVKAGYALLQGRSATDQLSTPLAQPFNGWTELFASVPGTGASHGLEARYLNTSGALRPLGGTTYAMTYYDYHSDSQRIHYGSELDLTLAYRVRCVTDRWEVGVRFGRYWADRLFAAAMRASVYTAFSL